MNKKMRRILMVVFVSAAAVVSLMGDMLYLNQNENVETKNEIQLMSIPSVYAGVNTEVESYLTNDKIITSITSQEVIKTMEAFDFNYIDGWTTTNVNVREEPSVDSEILEVFKFNTQVSYAAYDEEWAIIKYGEEYSFISLQYISNERCNYRSVSIPNYGGMKTYMAYTTITSTGSNQYKLQQIAYTGNYGCRMVNGRYCIAVGTAVTSNTGTYVDLVLANGTVIPCIVGDIKANVHTDAANLFTLGSNCCSEFIIDNSSLNSLAKQMGNMSYCCEEWNSRVVEIRVYDINVFD